MAAGLASAWLLTGVALWKRRNPMKAIVWLLAAVMALALIWDRRTGFGGWSVNFVLPCFIPCVQLAVFAATRVLRLRPADYLLYLGICLLAGLLPLIPLLRGTLWMIYPSVICGGHQHRRSVRFGAVPGKGIEGGNCSAHPSVTESI